MHVHTDHVRFVVVPAPKMSGIIIQLFSLRTNHTTFGTFIVFFF